MHLYPPPIDSATLVVIVGAILFLPYTLSSGFCWLFQFAICSSVIFYNKSLVSKTYSRCNRATYSIVFNCTIITINKTYFYPPHIYFVLFFDECVYQFIIHIFLNSYHPFFHLLLWLLFYQYPPRSRRKPKAIAFLFAFFTMPFKIINHSFT